jgi:uncharacterized protein YqeY
MALRDQLQADLKDAMKSGDAVRKTTIRGIMTSLNESEQRKREDLAKKALKKHNVAKPTNSDESTLAAYQQAVDAALAAENVEDAGKLDEMEAITVLQKLAKQRQESIDQASQAGRTDIAEAESVELSIVEAYLPRQMSREELEAEVRAVIAEVGATELRDMGKVMSPLMERLQGRADGKQVSEVVRLLLAQ